MYQTFSSDIQICCNKCIFVATCEEELNWHMFDVHELPDDLNFDTDFYCDVCSKWCKSESDLLIHKEEHNKKTDKVCSFFLRGICIYGDEKCWFSHKSDNDQVSGTANLYTCNLCEKYFTNEGAIMKHRKTEHPANVSECKNIQNGSCRFKEEKCWFKHSEIDIFQKEHPEIIEKLFSILETFTNRIDSLEKYMKISDKVNTVKTNVFQTDKI